MSMMDIWKDNKQLFTGRLVGFIDNEECRAVMNSPDAGKKIFTSGSIPMDSINSTISHEKRFVIATSDFDGTTRKIFISPVIRYMSYMGAHKCFKCEDDSEYSIKKIL